MLRKTHKEEIMTDSIEVRLPRQLMEQNDKAEQMLIETPPQETSVVENPVVPTEEKIEENQIQVQEPQPQENTQQAVELPKQIQESEQAPISSDVDELAKTWKEKYLVLQGKYNAEIPRLASELKQMRDELAFLKSQKEEAIKPKVEEKIDIRQIVPKETIDVYGEDLLNATVNASYKANKSKIEETNREVERLRNELANITAKSFESQVRSQIPDFDEVNTNPKFISWLDSLGLTNSLQNAGFSGDAKTVVNIFNQWKSLNTPAKPQANNVSPARKEERYIAPAKTNAPVQVPQEKKKWTAVEVNKVMTDIARGRYTYEDMKRLNTEIDSAIAEGRISA